MSVYVDKEENAYGRMVMCHMLADTVDELMRMATIIGVADHWVQRSRAGIIHFDICKAKRVLALKNGAIEIDRRKLVELMRKQAAKDT